jgi:hypothetical protein
VFYNRLEFIANSFLNKVTNHSILKSNLSLSEHYLPFKLYPKKASLKQLRKRLSKRLLRLRKKSSGKSRRATKPKSLTYGYNKLDM